MRKIFISGATGLIGSEYLRRLLTWETDATAWVLMRGRSEALVMNRARLLLLDMFPDASERARVQSRITFVRGNITHPRLGLSDAHFEQIAQEATDIVHSAADVRFDLSLEQAREVNLEGTRQMFGLAAHAVHRGNLRRYHQVSTFATARPRAGGNVVYEDPPNRNTAFKNTYEQTKAESELYILERKDEVPLSIYRPSTVVGDSRTGWTADFKVAYVIMKLFAAGAFNPNHIIQFQAGARSDGVNVDYVANSLYALSTLNRDPSGVIYNLVAGAGATTPSEWFRRASMELCGALRRRGLSAPNPMQIEEIAQLEPESMRGWLTDQSAFTSLVEFFPYITGTALYDDQNTQAALAGTRGCVCAPRLSDLGVLMEYCIESGWGERPGPRPTLEPSPLAELPLSAPTPAPLREAAPTFARRPLSPWPNAHPSL